MIDFIILHISYLFPYFILLHISNLSRYKMCKFISIYETTCGFHKFKSKFIKDMCKKGHQIYLNKISVCMSFSYSSKIYKVSKMYVVFCFLKNICVSFLKIVLNSMF